MVNTTENDRCWACERLKPRSSLAPKVDTPVLKKTSMQIPDKDSQFVQSQYSERNDRQKLFIAPKRKVGRPKKISLQEIVAEQSLQSCEMIIAAASGTSALDFAKTCTNRHQEHSNSHQEYESTTKSLASDLVATISENEIKRKRGRPKKIISPETYVLNIEQSSDFKEHIGEVEPNLNHGNSKQFKKLHSKTKYSKKNPRSPKSAHGNPSYPLELQSVNTDSNRRKVGRPKKIRCLEDSDGLSRHANDTNSHEESNLRMDRPNVKSKRCIFRCLGERISKQSFETKQSSMFDTNRSFKNDAKKDINKNQRKHISRGKKSGKKSKNDASKSSSVTDTTQRQNKSRGKKINKLRSKSGGRGDMN